MVRIEKQGSVWTIIHSRFVQARNAMDPDSADALVDAFKQFDADDSASVAVLWGEGGAFCAGWDLKFASTLSDRDAFQRHVVDGLTFPTGANAAPRGPLGPTRLELSKPVIAAREIARFPQAAVRADRRSVVETYGLPVRDALRQEWTNGVEAIFKEGASGAARFAGGKGRHGDFAKI